jgi:hypothetical protein
MLWNSKSFSWCLLIELAVKRVRIAHKWSHFPRFLITFPWSFILRGSHFVFINLQLKLQFINSIETYVSSYHQMVKLYTIEVTSKSSGRKLNTLTQNRWITEAEWLARFTATGAYQNHAIF